MARPIPAPPSARERDGSIREALKDLRLLLGREPRPSVNHGQSDLVGPGLGAHDDDACR